MSVAPRPPYSVGQPMPVQPSAAALACQARASASASSVSMPRPRMLVIAPADDAVRGGALASSQAWHSARKSASVVVSVKSRVNEG
jgi:hypothetical protein